MCPDVFLTSMEFRLLKNRAPKACNFVNGLRDVYNRYICHVSDVNECLQGRNLCRANQECRNTVGSYVCRDLVNCGSGYELDPLGSRCVGETSTFVYQRPDSFVL